MTDFNEHRISNESRGVDSDTQASSKADTPAEAMSATLSPCNSGRDSLSLRGDRECPHGHARRSKCDICDREDDHAEIARLAARCAELERDAARYRWLREHGYKAQLIYGYTAAGLDSAIDAAVKDTP